MHVSEGEVSGVGSNADAMVTFEREGAHLNENYVQFLTRTAGHSGLIFGDADSNDDAAVDEANSQNNNKHDKYENNEYTKCCLSRR